jgi:hypothetical protein
MESHCDTTHRVYRAIFYMYNVMYSTCTTWWARGVAQLRDLSELITATISRKLGSTMGGH